MGGNVLVVDDVTVIDNTKGEVIEVRNFQSLNLLDRFINYLDVSAKTVDTYKKGVKSLFRFFSSNGIKEPTREDILNYKAYLVASGLKPSTIQGYITVTRIFFRWCEQEGIYKNVADRVKGAKLTKDHKKDYLTTSQVKALLSAIDRESPQGLRDYAISALMVTGGLRTIEVIRANIEDLRTLGDSTVLYLQGKGKVEKTDYVKVSPQVEKAIRTYLTTRGKIEEGAPLFASLSNNSKGERMTTRAISGIIKAHLKKAGYDSDRLTAHSLRHTAVTLSLLAGRELAEVQQFARHANIATTMIYNHALDKAKNGCSEAVSNSIF